MEYEVINFEDSRFKEMCDACEENIVKENLREVGGTLNYSHLTYSSDCLIVCLQDNAPIGFNALSYYKEAGFYIMQLAVKRDYQRNGIGASLIKKAQTIADELGLAIYAHVRNYNIASQKTVESCGFKKSQSESTINNFFYVYKQKDKGEKHL